jgi:HK97 family phage major capsid protein
MVNTYDDLIGRSDAQALMPEDVSREILQEAVTRSAALTLLRRVPMSRNQQRKPALSAFPQAYWIDSDSGLKQTTTQLWANKYLNAGELAVLVPVPQAVFDDQDYDMWGEIRPRLAEAIGEKLDAAVFFGTDVPTAWTSVNGIVPDATSAGNVATLGDNADIGLDLSEAMGFVEDDGYDVTGHAGPRRLRARLRDARASGSGEPIFQSSLADSGPATVYGDPFAIFGNGAWDGSTLDVLGDYSQAMLGVRQDITFDVTNSGVIADDNGAVILSAFQQDSLILRVVARFAFLVANNITRQDTDPDSATRYPFAVLGDLAS